jgi:hypothetical protein
MAGRAVRRCAPWASEMQTGREVGFQKSAEFGSAGGRRDDDAGVTGQKASRAFLAAPQLLDSRHSQVRSGVPTPRLLRIASGTDLGSRERRALRNVANRRHLARLAKRHDPRPSCVDRRAACVHDVIADPVVACAPFSGVAGTRLCYGRTIGSRDPRLQVAADRCGLLIVSPCDSIARSDELRLEM